MELSLKAEYWWWIFLVTFGTLIYIFTGKDRRIKKFLKHIDGPFSLPVIGSGLWFLRPNYEIPHLLLSWQKKYGSIWKFWMGSQANVVLCGPPEIEKLCTSSVHIDKSTDYSWFHSWLGFGLLTASREKWHPRRKLLTPAFHFKILEEFVPIFNEQANVMVDILKNERCDGQSFDIFPYVTKCALDIISETAMGVKLHSQKGNKEVDYVNIIYGYGDILLKRWFQPWLQVGWIWNLTYGGLEKQYLEKLHGFTESVIAARKAERKNAKLMFNKTRDNHPAEDALLGKRRKAFLDLLLDLAETENSLTDLEIRQETDTFMFEGHDTTAANMAWTLFLLSFHPEHQKRVQAELEEIFGNDRNRDITPADVSKMKYLECCVKETLRIYPSVAFFIRHLREDCDIGNNRILPKGTNVYIGPFCVHRDPKIFPDPDVFNPERFLPENSVGRSPFAFIPFSAGPRNCIGQKFALLEEKIVLAKLLLNFNLQTTYKSRDEVKMLPDIILRPLGGISVKISPRN